MMVVFCLGWKEVGESCLCVRVELKVFKVEMGECSPCGGDAVEDLPLFMCESVNQSFECRVSAYV